MEGKDGGDGKSSPFGNHSGAPASGSKTGGQDFAKDPTGPKTGGGQDFISNPKSAMPGSPEDLVKTGGGNGGTQKTGPAPDISPESIPGGGKVMKKDPPAGYPAGDVGTLPGQGNGRKPFKGI